MKTLLELRNALKAKKPVFTRHDAHKKVRVGTGWRRPKGIQNKMRLHRKGYAKGRSSGYSSPTAVKGLSRTGLNIVRIHNEKELLTKNPKTDGIIISATVGARKKLALLQKIKELSYTLLQFNAEGFETRLQSRLSVKKNKKKTLLAKKQAKTVEQKPAKKKEQSVDESMTPEEKKIQEKKEHDKILTQKGDQQ